VLSRLFCVTLSRLIRYDDYKYGIAGGLNTSIYTAPLATNASALANQVAMYPQRDVRYIFGTLDVCACNTPGFENPSSCYDPAAGCAPNSDGGPGCCDTLPDGSNNAEAFACEDLVEVSNVGVRRLHLYCLQVCSPASTRACTIICIFPPPLVLSGLEPSPAWSLVRGLPEP
jgi:hypothetical protein